MSGQPTANNRSQLHLNSRLLPLTVAALALLQLAYPHRAWMTLLIGLGGVWLVAALWARSLRSGLRIEREVRSPWGRVGDEMFERLTLSNDGWAPAHSVVILDHSDLPGRRRTRAVAVGGHAFNRWHQTARCEQRGVYEVGPTTLGASDPFGLYEVELHQPASATLTVLPPTVRLPEFELAGAGRLARGGPKRAGSARSVSSNSVRSYSPGDSLRWVHWPTSARHGDLYIKTFDPVADGGWWIFLDLDHAVQAGKGPRSTEEHGVILAASLAAQGLDSGRSVGLVTQDQSGSAAWLVPAPGPRQRRRLLRQLATARQGPHTLATLLRAAGSQLSRPASLLLITPAPAPAWAHNLQPLLARGARATIFALDRASYDHPSPDGPRDHWRRQAGVTVHVIDRAWLEARLPGKEPALDWRQVEPGARPWRPLTP